jgi:hypothetical protein
MYASIVACEETVQDITKVMMDSTWKSAKFKFLPAMSSWTTHLRLLQPLFFEFKGQTS